MFYSDMHLGTRGALGHQVSRSKEEEGVLSFVLLAALIRVEFETPGVMCI